MSKFYPYLKTHSNSSTAGKPKPASEPLGLLSCSVVYLSDLTVDRTESLSFLPKTVFRRSSYRNWVNEGDLRPIDPLRPKVIILETYVNDLWVVKSAFYTV